MIKVLNNIKSPFFQKSKKFDYYFDISKDKRLMDLYVENEKYDGYIRDNCLFREDIDIYDKMSAQIAATDIGFPLIDPELSIKIVTNVSLNSISFSFLKDIELKGSIIITDPLILCN